MQRRNVLLPEPLAPRMAITSPFCGLHRDALQHLDLPELLLDPLGSQGQRLIAHGALERSSTMLQDFAPLHHGHVKP